jgi:hypothetical protein
LHKPEQQLTLAIPFLFVMLAGIYLISLHPKNIPLPILKNKPILPPKKMNLTDSTMFHICVLVSSIGFAVNALIPEILGHIS